MLIEVLGWICTVLVLIAYFTNAKNMRNAAFIFWMIGDLGWIVYDVLINNVSHATLCAVIILINIYGLYNHNNKKGIIQ